MKSSDQAPNSNETKKSGVKFQPVKFDGALLDSIVLGVLLVAMCSQLNLGDIGKNTSAEGYVTKQLKVALPDIALFLSFAWFAARTTFLKAWKKLWWPPLPCFALIFCMVLAALHSRPLTNAVAESIADAHGAKQILKALITQESKEAVAETIQFTGYFLIAPLLFVNLIHDRRGEILISRRRLALTTFLWAVLASITYALRNRSDLGFQGFFGSPNALSGFLAIALSLLGARLFWREGKWRRLDRLILLSILAAFAIVSSLWSLLALVIGLIVASTLAPNRPRAALIAFGFAVPALIIWLLAPAPMVTVRPHAEIKTTQIVPPLRVQSARISSATEKVKKQYVEWFVAIARLADRRESGFATGAAPGNYQFNIGSYFGRLASSEKVPPDSNNLYLVQAVNLGVLGLGALLWVVLHFAQIAARARERFPTDWLSAGVLAALAAWIFVNFFHALIVRGTGTTFAFILSLAVIAAERDWNSQEELETELSEADRDWAGRNFLDGALS